jgi:hypothetical protein
MEAVDDDSGVDEERGTEIDEGELATCAFGTTKLEGTVLVKVELGAT